MSQPLDEFPEEWQLWLWDNLTSLGDKLEDTGIFPLTWIGWHMWALANHIWPLKED